MLVIKNPETVKIQKVRQSKVYFEADGQHYLLKEADYDGYSEHYWDLFHRPNKDRKVVEVDCKMYFQSTHGFTHNKERGYWMGENGHTYSRGREAFVLNLIEHGFAELDIASISGKIMENE